MNNDKLKPCPFCGSNKQYIEYGCGSYKGEKRIACDTCQKSAPYFNTEEEAIKFWNTREYEKAYGGTPEQVEKMKNNLRYAIVVLQNIAKGNDTNSDFTEFTIDEHKSRAFQKAVEMAEQALKELGEKV